MTYPLAKFDELVAALLAFKMQEAELSSETLKNLYALLQQTADEAEHVRAGLLQEIMGIRKKKALTLFIQNFQTACVAIADKMYVHLYTMQSLSIDKNTAGEIVHYYKAILEKVDDILYFIEIHFTKYFDRMQKLPVHYYIRWRQKIYHALAALKPSMHLRFKDILLVETALQPFEQFTQPLEGKDFCYHDLIYLKNLLPALQQQIQNEDTSDDMFDVLTRCLLTMDFNSSHFINHCMEKWKKKIAESDDKNEQITHWFICKKNLCQISVQPHLKLMVTKDSAIKILGNYINEEIQILQSENSNELRDTSVQHQPEHKIFHFTLPVSQIAILLRLLVEAGFIKAQNQTDFLKRVAMVIQTDKTSMVSAESLRNKYYAPERNQLLSVKDLLFNLIKFMKRLE